MSNRLSIAICALLAGLLTGAAAVAGNVKWQELSGRKVHISMMQVRKVSTDGGPVYTQRQVWNFQIAAGADGAIQYSRESYGQWLDKPGKKKNSTPVKTVRTALGKVHTTPDGGRGTAVWMFEDSRLRRLSVENVGSKGRMFLIDFAQHGSTLTCKATIEEVGEVGQGKTWTSPRGETHRLVGVLEQSTRCEVK